MLYHIGVLLHPILFHRICVWTGQCLSRSDVFFSPGSASTSA